MARWLSIGKCRGEMIKNVLLRGSQIVALRPFCTGGGETKANKKIVWKERDWGKILKDVTRKNYEWFGIPYPDPEAEARKVKKMSREEWLQKYLRDIPGVRAIDPVYDVIDDVLDSCTDYALLKTRIDENYKSNPNRELEYDYASFKLAKLVREGKIVVPPPDEFERRVQEIKQEDAQYNKKPRRMPTFLNPRDPELTDLAKRAIDSYNLSQGQEDSKIRLVNVCLAYTRFDLDKTRLIIEAKPLNAPDDQPAKYDCFISAKDKKLLQLTPFPSRDTHAACNRAVGMDNWSCQCQALKVM